MKLIFVFSVVLCVTFSKTIPPALVTSWNKLLEPHQQKCIEESHVDPDVVKNMFNRNEFPDNRELGCYLKCMFKSLNYYGPNGQLDGDLIVKSMDNATKVDYSCITKFQTETDLCANAYKISPVLVTSWNQLVKPFQDKCIEESQVDPDLAKNVFNRNYFPDEKPISCYFKCLHENLNNYGPDGELNGDLVAKTIAGASTEIANPCIDKFKSETDRCTKAYRVSGCLAEANLID
ncbi:hypothetical protein RN001_007757 [Aquatica leii]|uniref:Uncharacterized protein n=1 Tax=Aquatica leii TaxID=1421715 RepID=A0AAN7PC72_9COLE|nr:hypothetical protein RN001_007757 [Aquatica leii]